MNPRLLFALSLLVPASTHASLVAHWKLDSSSAEETASYPATWGAAPTYQNSVAAPESTAAADLAEGNWLAAGTGIDFERHQPFSATAWIKGGAQDSAVVGDMVQSEGPQGWELHVGTTVNGADSQSVTVWLANDYPASAIQVNASVPVLDNQWHHVAFTYDGSSSGSGVKIYVDGLPVATTVSLDTLGANISNAAFSPLNIGTRMNGANHNFTGSIDEVALFNHEASAGEMAAIFQFGVESVTFPYVADTVPLPGQSVTSLSSADVKFSVPVAGVDATDLLVNGIPATGIEVIDARNYRFTFSSPPQGDVHFSWVSTHGIAGLNEIAAQPAGWSSLFAPVLPTPQLAIAEFLTQNAGGLTDEDFDTPDWIELVNPGSSDVNMAGWTLTDDPARPKRWTLPSLILRPGERKIVFASGKDRAAATGTLHTNFKLSAEPGYLALFDPSGNPAHAYNYPRQEANISFGLLAGAKPSDGRAAWRYLTPTPTAATSGVVYSGAAIEEVKATPEIPQAGEPVTVTIRISPETVLSSPPALRFRFLHGAESQTVFADDGLHGDGAAGDRVWGAVIPTTLAGQMVRWKVSLTSNGLISRWPVNTNTNVPLPLYEGTVVGGSPAGQALPVYQIFVPGYTFPTTTNQTGIDSDAGARGAFFGNGKLYDNVLIRIKGTTSRYLMKRSHRVDFNPGRDFEWSPDYPAQRELNLNSEYNDPSYLRQNLQLWMHRDSGNAGSLHFPVRVTMNGQNWHLAFHTYSADSELIETMGLDPRGALYKQVGTLNTSSNPEKKSRRWEGYSDYYALRSGIASSASSASKSLYMFDNFNLPAVINYLAVARIAQEGDDVWANMVVYRDSDGTREWQPIPFDLNLSFGQLFFGGDWENTTVHATMDANKSHPLYGSASCLANTGPGTYNRLYDAVIQNPTTRAMLLRRIRSLMDRYLMAPGTPAANSPLEARFDSLGALIQADADIDRARWGLPPNDGAYGLGPGISPAQGLATLKSSFLVPRRTHFYTTHSVNNTGKLIGLGNNNNAGIPNAQVANPTINFGATVANPPTGNQDEEYIELVNPGTAAVDISDWLLRGAGGSFTFKGGTVVPAGGSIFVSPNVRSFRSRGSSPKGSENRFAVGPYSGHLSPYGEKLVLENAVGGIVAQQQVAADPNAPAVNIEVTEILSSSNHVDNTINGDWWELTNNSTQALDLAGFSWDDSRDLAGQAVFGAVTIGAGESIIILDEDDDDEAHLFRQAWGLPDSVKILTREDFGIESMRGLGNGDSVIVYLPGGSEVARANYPAHVAGRSRAWFRNGTAVQGGYSTLGKYGATASLEDPGDVASPGFAAADPASLTDPYEVWAAAHDLWSSAATWEADPDGDGRSNRTEYAFGGSPDLADSAPALLMQRAGADVLWTFTRRNNDASLVVKVDSSPDMTTWTETTLPLVSQVPHPTMSGFVTVTYRITPADDARFFRARTD
ncbi:lamin tail domain-containing protein [Luteolibacter luteus]|uniref:LTD domain-containing protein n=1 Tax=Luteolibacter luteus TaxID=2728835 RepID=A0A858RFF9_9BACT|nr:lamin tail domain-containing protein [Luteolibacter luteus]QJE95288.1 hypothetical protein HHL09_05685 [Luteolibacter luteus]